MKTPHMARRALSPPGENRIWECQFCHQTGLWDELEALPCTHEYKPCKYCGKSPECALDCPGILAILSSPEVHLVTDDEAMKARVARERRRRGKA